MTERSAVSLAKWPFFIADALLSGVAGFILYRSLPPQNMWQIVLTCLCLAAGAWGAWLWIMPFLLEFRAANTASETAQLANAIEQIRHLETVGMQVQNSTAQWQTAQESANKTVAAAGQIAQKIEAEGRAFMQFMERAQEQERANLRLEIEKLRRAEADWLQVTIRILDHIYALNLAAARSGQPNVINQLGQFQNACRDIARRMGLVPFTAQKEEEFNAQAHQLADPKETPPAESLVGETLATGFTYQGQLVRKAVVALQKLEPDPQQQLL